MVAYEKLTSAQGTRLLAGLEDLCVLGPQEAFPAVVLSVVSRLIRCDSASFNEIELSTNRFRVLSEPADLDPDLNQAFARFVHQHPVIAHFGRTGDAESHTISDFLDPVEFRRLGLYGEFFRLLGIDDQLSTSLLVAQGDRVIGVALNRSGSFPDDSRLLLNALRPHLVIAYQNASRYSQAIRQRCTDGEPAATATRALGTLTDRQLDVLRLVAAGFTNVRVAGELDISVATVKKHVEHILARLQVESRLGAARLYLSGASPNLTEGWWTIDGEADRQLGSPGA